MCKVGNLMIDIVQQFLKFQMFPLSCDSANLVSWSLWELDPGLKEAGSCPQVGAIEL